MTRLLSEFGQGTSLRRGDATQAVRRGMEDALWRNSINLAELFGVEKAAMRLTVEAGVPRADTVDVGRLRDVLPYGTPTFRIREGGLAVPRPEGEGEPTLIASVIVHVALEGVDR